MNLSRPKVDPLSSKLCRCFFMDTGSTLALALEIQNPNPSPQNSGNNMRQRRGVHLIYCSARKLD
jgi:hypothetical protein